MVVLRDSHDLFAMEHEYKHFQKKKKTTAVDSIDTCIVACISEFRLSTKEYKGLRNNNNNNSNNNYNNKKIFLIINNNFID